MAAFSYQLPNSFLLDSGFFQDPNPSLHPDFHRTDQSPDLITSVGSKFQESSCLTLSDNENANSVTRRHSTDSSTVSVVDYKLESGQQVSQKLGSMDKKRKIKNITDSAQVSKGVKEVAGNKKQKKCNGVRKDEEKESKADKKDQKKVAEEPPKGYIHVRARRGQATDSHSLAERVRRERISERMKILQKLVPGCDKVTGKALMLDEIINYVQSLQNQVEFLSLKLAALNPMFYDFGLDAFMIRPEVITEGWEGLKPGIIGSHFVVDFCIQKADEISVSDKKKKKGLNGLAFPLPSLQQSNPNQSTAFTDSTGLAHISPQLLDASVLLHPGRSPNVFPQHNGSQLWDVDNHRQKLLNSAGFSDNLCSFH